MGTEMGAHQFYLNETIMGMIRYLARLVNRYANNKRHEKHVVVLYTSSALGVPLGKRRSRTKINDVAFHDIKAFSLL